MEEKHGEGDKHNPAGSNDNGSPNTGEDSGKTRSADAHTTTIHTIHHEPLKIVVENKQSEDSNAANANQIAKKSNRIASGANWISFLNFLLAIAVFFITYKLFQQTQKSTDAAVAAAKSADSTYQEQKYNDRIMRDRDSARSRNDSVSQSKKDTRDSVQFAINIANERKRFKNDSASTQAQINSLKQSRENFELENRPFITSANIQVDTTFLNNTLEISVQWVNIGKFPAKIISLEGYSAIGRDTLYLERRTPLIKKLTNQFIAGNLSAPIIYYMNDVPLLYQIQLKKGDLHCFIKGILIYQTFGKSKVYNKHFTYEVTLSPRREFFAVLYF